MTWAEIDWPSLNRHRERFLGGKAADGPYWSSAADLAGYDFTFGERIGWKWDAVLDELEMKSWKPGGGILLDWGCGSGIAGRRVAARFGEGIFSSMLVSDHSVIAGEFARAQAQAAFPKLPASVATDHFLADKTPIGLLVISHVLNELIPSAIEQLRALASRASSILWTEPGSRETSRLLGMFRDEWIGDFQAVAPCTHQNLCPILAPGNERHWCHHFASPPSAIFANSDWVKFGQRIGIDLRSLPYSFLALDRTWRRHEEGFSRIIGRPEYFKPYARLLNCDADGLKELLVTKRENAPLYKALTKEKRPLVYKWEREGDKIHSGSQPSPRS